jgi:uncharacterized protein YacL
MTVSKEQKNTVAKTLSPELSLKYQNIATERRNIYILGLAVGLVCAALVLNFASLENVFYKTVVCLATVTSVSALVYLLTPKSDYMLNHLTTQEQTKAWLQVYRHMKYRYYLGFALGSLISVPLALSMC